MKWYRFSSLAILMITALVLFGTSQAWALGTVSGADITNTASVSFTYNGTNATVDSNTDTFKVDRKIRPVVTKNSDASIVAGGTDYVLKFTVTNESNTAAGSDFFVLDAAVLGGNATMVGATIYNDDGITAGTWDNTATTYNPAADVINIGNSSGSNSAVYYIVADAEILLNNGFMDDANEVATWTLQATAWTDGNYANGALVGEAATDTANDKAAVDIVFADDAGTALAGDNAYDGIHSATGTYTVITPISLSKNSTTPNYFIPGALVTYTVTITNSDLTLDATNVTLFDQIPTETTYSASSLGCPDVTWKAECSTDNFTTIVLCSDTATTYVRCTDGTVASGGATAAMTFDVNIK